MTRGRPTLVDVATEAGVSLKTASRVINGITTVNPALTTRVNAAIEKLGYRRNTMAANLRAGSTDTIGLVTADLANAFYTRLASAISAVAMTHGHHVIMASTEEDADAERRITLSLCQRQVGALIVVPSGDDQGHLAAETRSGIPAVFLDRPGRNIAADAVLLDNRGGAEASARRLVTDGHRRIGVLLDDLSIFTMTERLEGFRSGVAGSPIDDRLFTDRAHSPEAARARAAEMLALDDPPTAFFCGNNRSTIGTVSAVLEAHADVAIVGFDDFESAHILPVDLTIVDYDADKMGALAADRLFDRIDGDRSPPRTHLVPTTLVRRGRRA